MKRLGIVLGLALLISGCDVHTSGAVEFDAEDITYGKDSRTGLCYGIVASRKSFSTDATGLGLTCVPCESVEHLIGK